MLSFAAEFPVKHEHSSADFLRPSRTGCSVPLTLDSAPKSLQALILVTNGRPKRETSGSMS